MKDCKLCKSQKLICVYEKVKDILFDAAGEYSYYKCTNCGIVNMFSPKIGDLETAQYTKEYSDRKKENAKNILKKLIRNLMVYVGDDSLMYRSSKFLRYLIGTITGVILLSNREKMGVYLTDTKRNKLLDVGCGSGDYLHFMKQIGWDVMGVEISQHSVESTRSKGIDVFHGPIEDFQYENLFDVITLRHVIEHIDDPLQFLLKIKTLLNKDGKIYIATPNFDSFNSSLYKRDWLGLDVSRHEVIYNKKSLEYLVKLLNMNIESITVSNRIGRFIIYASEMRSKGFHPYRKFLLSIKTKSYLNHLYNIIARREGDEIFMVIKV